MSALGVQVGGGHYKGLGIQPVEFIHANSIPFFEGNIIKYVVRWRDKGGIEDLRKARHYLDMLIEFEEAKVEQTEMWVPVPFEGNDFVDQLVNERLGMAK